MSLETTERVAVIVPNWNGKRFLDACLLSLRQQTFKAFTTYVVDNGSSDGSVEYLRAHYPEVKVVAHADNLGFSAAINAGIRASSGEYIAALNNDTEVDPHWLEVLVAVLDVRSDVGLCASKVLDFADRRVIDSYGDGYARTGIAFKVGILARDRGQFSKPLEVLSPCAAASIYRRSLFEDIGVFDEDFFCYMEDVDIGLRAALAGYRCLVVPDALVYHIGSASTGGGMSAFSLLMTAQNFPMVVCKNIPGAILWKILPRVVAAQAVLVMQTLLGQRPDIARNFRCYWQGLWRSLRNLPGALQKRRLIQRQRRISAEDFYQLLLRSEAQKRQFRD